MSRKTICKTVLTVALGLAACTAPITRTAAQSTTSSSSGSSSVASSSSGGSGSNIVTGTDPEPDYVGITGPSQIVAICLRKTFCLNRLSR
jgi:hypothetical protein